MITELQNNIFTVVVGCECPAFLYGNAQQSLRCARHSVVDVDQLCT